MTPRRLGPALARWGVLIVVLGVCGAALGGAYGFVTPRQFEARADFLIEGGLTGGGGGETTAVSQRDVVTQTAIMVGQAVAVRAQASLGREPARTGASSADESNVVSLTVTGASEEEALENLEAYVASYLAVVSEQQRAQLEQQIAVMQESAAAAQAEVQQLDEALTATPAGRQDIVLAQQSSQRTDSAVELRDTRQSVLRLESSLAALPFNIQRFTADRTPVEPDGLLLWQWAALGGLLGAGVGVVVALRLAEQRGTSRP